jgi:ketosteroid isomerase-like protein
VASLVHESTKVRDFADATLRRPAPACPVGSDPDRNVEVSNMTASPDSVLELVQRWAAAEQQNDADLLDRLLAEDFVGVGPLGFVLNRDQWLARFRNGLVNRRVVVEEPQVHDHGTAAVVVGVEAQETQWQGRDNSGRFRLTLTAVRASAGWRIASLHIGPLQVATAAPAS